MASPLQLVGISGSLRKASYNTGLLRAAAELVPEGVVFTIVDLEPVPFFNQELEADLPAGVQALRAALHNADGLLIASPEYNYSFTGILKNAIDWASRPRDQSPLIGMPIALIGAGGRLGTVRSQLHLRQVLVETNSLVLNKPELLIPMAWEKFDKQGNLTDEATRERLAELVQALVDWTRRMRG